MYKITNPWEFFLEIIYNKFIIFIELLYDKRFMKKALVIACTISKDCKLFYTNDDVSFQFMPVVSSLNYYLCFVQYKNVQNATIFKEANDCSWQGLETIHS